MFSMRNVPSAALAKLRHHKEYEKSARLYCCLPPLCAARTALAAKKRRRRGWLPAAGPLAGPRQNTPKENGETRLAAPDSRPGRGRPCGVPGGAGGPAYVVLADNAGWGR